MTALAAADKRRITEDWAREFPELGVWKPLRLLRRVGPIVQGVTLDVASSGDYLPTAHVHSLTRPFPTVAMTSPTALRTAGGVQDRVRLRRHSPEVVADAAQRLRASCPLPLQGVFSIDVLVAVYQKDIAERQRPGWPVSVNEIEDQVLVPVVVGRSDLVEVGLNFARSIAADWPSEALERWGRGNDWLEGLAALASRRDELEATIEVEVTAHRLASLPFVPLC